MVSNAAALTAADIMTRSLVLARPEQDLLEIEGLLFERRISGLPVVDEGRLVGVVSASDVSRVQVLMNSLDGQVNDSLDWPQQADGFAHAQPPQFSGFRQMITRLKVQDAMRDHVVVCAPNAPLAEVAQVMLAERIHRIIVVEGERPVGIISSLDLVKVLAGQLSRGTEN
jgi:CBS domain-containing protein